MEIYTITGRDLQYILDQFAGDTGDIRKIRIAIDEGTVKIKINEYTWSPPLGKRGN